METRRFTDYLDFSEWLKEKQPDIISMSHCVYVFPGEMLPKPRTDIIVVYENKKKGD